MGETAGRPVRALARALTFGVPLVVVVGALAAACAETKAPIGGACLKSQDCLSGICSQLVCSAAPPTTDTEANNPDASAAAETGSEEAAAPEGAPEAAPEASPGGDGGDGGVAEAAGD
jgi:hypothetical protein